MPVVEQTLDILANVDPKVESVVTGIVAGALAWAILKGVSEKYLPDRARKSLAVLTGVAVSVASYNSNPNRRNRIYFPNLWDDY